MKIIQYDLKNFYFFVIILIKISTINPLDSDALLLRNVECKSILMDGKIIFINVDDRTDNNIYYYNYDSTPNSGSFGINYSSNIYNHKNILKLNNNEFIIFGFNLIGRDQIFSYQRYSINHENFQVITGASGQTNFQVTVIEEFDSKVIANSYKLIFSGRIDTKFATYLYDLNASGPDILKKYEIPDNTISGYEKKDIRCNSINGNNFLCVYYYQKNRDDEYYMYFVNGNFYDDNEKIIRNIECQNGVNGNVERINDYQYLLCFQEKFSGHFVTVCRYYTYISNYFKEGEEEYRFNSQTIKSFISIPLIIQNYGYSNIILYDFNTDESKYAYISISSLNFKIKMELKLFAYNADSLTVNFFNDDKYIYHTFKDGTGTYLKRQNLIQCKKAESITLSNLHNNAQFKFIEGTDNFDIRFSINDNLKFIPSRNKYVHSQNENKTFIFQKGEKAGVFDNYYIYSYSTLFSLICSLNITSCHSLCEECTFNLTGTDENNYCKKCISGYNHKEDEYSNIRGFNCYHENELIQYYYSDSGILKCCHKSCKYCDNPNTCRACIDGYSFIYETYLKIDDICYDGELKGYYLSTSESISNSYDAIKLVIHVQELVLLIIIIVINV